MLVKLKRNWYAPNGRLYRSEQGLAEIADEFKDRLPSDAVVLSESGSLPTKDVRPQPGFGAKPEHEQTLDQIPYAAPTHLQRRGAGEMPDAAGLHPDKTPRTEKDLEADAKARERAEADDERDRKALVKEEAGAVKEGLQAAKKMEDAKADGDPTRKSQIKI